MATRKQIAANRRNALKSTGPRTASGKAKSRFNALRHGFRSQHPEAVVALEGLPDASDLIAIRSHFERCFEPQTLAQADAVSKMACARWQQLRSQRSEARFFNLVAQMEPAYEAALMDEFSKRQDRYHRAFARAFRKYVRHTETPGPA